MEKLYTRDYTSLLSEDAAECVKSDLSFDWFANVNMFCFIDNTLSDTGKNKKCEYIILYYKTWKKFG